MFARLLLGAKGVGPGMAESLAIPPVKTELQLTIKLEPIKSP